MQIYCCPCRSHVNVTLASGKEIYPHRPDLKHHKFWRCNSCQGYVGVHAGTETPLGVIPTPAMRTLRTQLHAIIDPLWKSKKMTRSQVYAAMSRAAGRQFHTADTRSVEELKNLIEFARMLSAGEIK